MWDHPFTAEGLKKLKMLGFTVIDPITKTLACNEKGVGALANVIVIRDFLFTTRIPDRTEEDNGNVSKIISAKATSNRKPSVLLSLLLSSVGVVPSFVAGVLIGTVLGWKFITVDLFNQKG